jgi:hypothetical protein
MPSRFQIVIDCRDPVRESTFWMEALGYRPEPPPKGFDSWKAFWMHIGLPEDDQFDGVDSIVDPHGAGPRIWFHIVPEEKICKNRIHFDIGVTGGLGTSLDMKTRTARVEAEATRLVRLGAKRLEALEQPGLDHYAVAMADPEGNEFDIN